MISRGFTNTPLFSSLLIILYILGSKVLRVETAGVKLDKYKLHSLVRLCNLVPAVVHSLKEVILLICMFDNFL